MKATTEYKARPRSCGEVWDVFKGEPSPGGPMAYVRHAGPMSKGDARLLADVLNAPEPEPATQTGGAA